MEAGKDSGSEKHLEVALIDGRPGEEQPVHGEGAKNQADGASNKFSPAFGVFIVLDVFKQTRVSFLQTLVPILKCDDADDTNNAPAVPVSADAPAEADAPTADSAAQSRNDRLAARQQRMGVAPANAGTSRALRALQ